MTHFMRKFAIIVILLTLGACIGVEISSIGIARIYGPINPTRIMNDSTSLAGYTTDQRNYTYQDDDLSAGDRTGEIDYVYPDDANARVPMNRTNNRNKRGHPESIISTDKRIRNKDNEYTSNMTYERGPELPPVKDAPVNQLADKTAGLLQRLSQFGMQTVVKLFNSLF